MNCGIKCVDRHALSIGRKCHPVDSGPGSGMLRFSSFGRSKKRGVFLEDSQDDVDEGTDG